MKTRNFEKEFPPLIERIVEARDEYSRLAKRGERDAARTLGSPATEAGIRTVERTHRIKLPEDYRAFLRLHDGWKSFSGDYDLLSTGQMTGGPMSDFLKAWKRFQDGEGHAVAARGFLIQASSVGGLRRAILYDVSSQRRDGGMDLVDWDSAELERFPTFLDYLENWASVCEGLLARKRR